MRARWGRIPFDRPRAPWACAVALQPAKRAAAYSQGRKPLDSRPTPRHEPPKGGDRPSLAHPDRSPLRGLAALLGAGIPRLPPGAIGGRLLPEPDGTRPGLRTAQARRRPRTRPTSIPDNRWPLAPRCRLPSVRGPVIWTAMTSRTSPRVGPSVTRGVSPRSSRGVSASSSRRGPTVSSPLGAGPGSMGLVRCVPAGAGYPLTVPAPPGPAPLPYSPRSGRQPIARGGSPWILGPRCAMSPRRGRQAVPRAPGPAAPSGLGGSSRGPECPGFRRGL